MSIEELIKKAYNYGEMHQSLLKDEYSLSAFLAEHKEHLTIVPKDTCCDSPIIEKGLTTVHYKICTNCHTNLLG